MIDRQQIKNNIIENENDIRLLSTTALSPFARYVSSSRGQMFSSAISQHFVIANSEPNTIQTGAEFEYGRFTHAISTPHNIRIEAIVDRYNANHITNIAHVPQRVVIYSTFDDGGNKPTYGMIDLVRMSHNHPKFGYYYRPTRAAENIKVGASIPKDTVLYDSPAKDELGNYSFGRNLNTAYINLEGTIEDSIMMSKKLVNDLKTTVFNTSTFELGSADFPLNLYGDDDHYKVLPDIGEYCRPTGIGYDGLIMAKREYKPELLPITFTRNKTRVFNDVTDIGLDGGGYDARVVDIIVLKQSKALSSVSPGVMSQLDKYAKYYLDFCESIVAEYRKIMAKHNGQVNFTDEFDQLIRHCMAYTNYQDSNAKLPAIQKVANFGRKLDDVIVIVTTEVIKEIGPGFKVMDLVGGKGVINKLTLVDPDELPYDPVTGIRAEIAISGETTYNRMNSGRQHEQEVKSAMLELERYISQVTGLTKDTPGLREKVLNLKADIKRDIFNRIELFLDIMTVVQHDEYVKWSDKEKTEDLYHIIKSHFYLYMPHDNPKDITVSIEQLKSFGLLSPPNRVRWFNHHLNREEESILPIRIGPVYHMCLEKIGDDASAVSAAATQPNGIIVPLTSKDKSINQVRKQATHFPGETEFRLISAGTMDGLAVELHDRSNNPLAVEKIMESIYRTDKPTDIDAVIDRNEVPLGTSRPLQILRQFIQCAGAKMMYTPFKSSMQKRAEFINGRNVMEIEDDADEDEADAEVLDGDVTDTNDTDTDTDNPTETPNDEKDENHDDQD